MASDKCTNVEKEVLKRTGIFGGTFNPIHIGHLALANYLCEYGELDEIWFMVSPQNPFKADRKLLEDSIRLEMVKAAVAEYPYFHASDFEFSLPRPSYTVDTLHALSVTYPNRQFTLIVGADNWASFSHWQSPEAILSQYSLIVYPRPGYQINELSLPKNVRTIQTPLLEISSTFIRQAVAQGKDIRYFVHPDVWRIITERKLYTDSET